MTDDVTNLRELAEAIKAINGIRPMPLASADLCRRVANEMERLRAEITSITEEHGRVWERVREQEAEIERLRLKAVELGEQVVQQADEIERLHSLEDELAALIDESHGVAGYHLNGDVAAWEELLPGGRYEVLDHFDIPMGGWKRK